MTSVADRDDPMSVLSHELPVAELFDRGVVYRPQHDSHLLIDAVRQSGAARGVRAADLCTGSGVIAHAIADMGAASVVAVDASVDAVRTARALTSVAADRIMVEHNDVADFCRRHTFDLVTCNPPYVPTPTDRSIEEPHTPRAAWEAGSDGREVLDVVCASAHDLLEPGGSMFVVQSEFADIEGSVRDFRTAGLDARVVASRMIPFGPVMTAHADWLESVGRLEAGRRIERLAVIRATKAPARRTVG